MWFLPGCLEGCELMNDETLAILAPSITKMGTTPINNGTYRWFAERYYVSGARDFNGNYGFLDYGYLRQDDGSSVQEESGLGKVPRWH